MAEYFRGQLLHQHARHPAADPAGGRPAGVQDAARCWRRRSRPPTASTAATSCARTPPLPGTEEYLDSEKYEIKVRDWDAPGNIKDYVARINRIRREHPALARVPARSRFYASDDDNVLFYGKRSADGGDLVWVAVNLDPFEAHEARLELPHRPSSGCRRTAASRCTS